MGIGDPDPFLNSTKIWLVGFPLEFLDFHSISISNNENRSNFLVICHGKGKILDSVLRLDWVGSYRTTSSTVVRASEFVSRQLRCMFDNLHFSLSPSPSRIGPLKPLWLHSKPPSAIVWAIFSCIFRFPLSSMGPWGNSGIRNASRIAATLRENGEKCAKLVKTEQSQMALDPK